MLSVHSEHAREQCTCTVIRCTPTEKRHARTRHGSDRDAATHRLSRVTLEQERRHFPNLWLHEGFLRAYRSEHGCIHCMHRYTVSVRVFQAVVTVSRRQRVAIGNNAVHGSGTQLFHSTTSFRRGKKKKSAGRGEAEAGCMLRCMQQALR